MRKGQEIIDSKAFQEYWSFQKPTYVPMKYIYILVNDQNYVKFGVTKRNFYNCISELEYSSFYDIQDWYCNGIQYSNADALLKELCKKYKDFKYKGQWFSIDYKEALKEFKNICTKKGNVDKEKIKRNPDFLDASIFALEEFNNGGSFKEFANTFLN